MIQYSGYLEQRRAGWCAVVDVPPSLRPVVGRKRLRKGLSTKDKHVALQRLRKAVRELHDRIEAACRSDMKADPRMAEALAIREELARLRQGDTAGWPGIADREEHAEDGRAAIEDAQAQAEGVLYGVVEDRAEEIRREEGQSRAGEFADLALGRVTPLSLHVETWLTEPGRKGRRHERTKAEYRGIMAQFAEWLPRQQVPSTLEAVTRQVAGRYVSALLQAGKSDARVRDVTSALSGYWQWLGRRGFVPEGVNPWPRQAPVRVRDEDRQDERERTFTEAEVVKLLTAPPDATMGDLMRVAALSGMRVEEICQLTVGQCSDGLFAVRAGKTAAAVRKVPIHTDLAPIVAKRRKDKPSAAWLFPEFGEPNRFGMRSPNAIARFHRYRIECGVDDKRQDHRRSLVNFHSWRRWFITEAIRAGQLERVVKQVVGHKQPKADVTLSAYFGGDLPAAMRACVEAVKLPPAVRKAKVKAKRAAVLSG